MFTTLFARSPKALLARLAALTPPSPDSTVLFALSANIEPSYLSQLVSQLTSNRANNVGCLSAPFPFATSTVSCSLALFSPEEAIAFRSEIPGKRRAQVGRWHTRGRARDGEFISLENEPTMMSGPNDWDKIWATGGKKVVQLPPELRTVHPEQVAAVFYLSDDAPEGLLQSLNNTLPGTPTLGLVASSTPFVTGHPFTLFRNGQVLSSGAVGLALLHKPLQRMLSFQGLESVGTRMQVSSAESNLVHALDQANPTTLLLSAIEQRFPQASADAKDHEYFLGLFAPDGNFEKAFRITAGGPSRGSLSLDSDACLPIGSYVQFLVRPSGTSTTIKPDIAMRTVNAARRLTLVSTEEPHTPRTDLADNEVTELDGVFAAASENGFWDGPEEGIGTSWKCSVPGASATWKWAQ